MGLRGIVVGFFLVILRAVVRGDLLVVVVVEVVVEAVVTVVVGIVDGLGRLLGVDRGVAGWRVVEVVVVVILVA